MSKRCEFMETPVIKREGWARAAGCVVFAGIAFLLVRAHGFLHWQVLSRHYREIPESVRPELFATLSRLVVASHCLALAAVIWCVWSWRRESRLAAVVATVFAGLALLLAFSMVMT